MSGASGAAADTGPAAGPGGPAAGGGAPPPGEPGWLAAWGRLLQRRGVAWSVVLLTAAVAVLAGALAGQIRQEDDLLAFLPPGNAEVATFREINERFGGLDVALVGVEAGPRGVFDPEFLAALDALTRSLEATPDLDHVLSLANVQDFTPDPTGGIVTAQLMKAVPTGPEQAEALKAEVLTRDAVVGRLVDREGRGVVVYVFPAFGADTAAVATAVESAARAALPPDATLHLGGAPFISSAIYAATQADMARLTPWAVAAVVLTLLLAFRDLRTVSLSLVSAGIAIVVVVASMRALDVPLNVVLGAMPVILFAVGSAYGIHLMARYAVHAQGLEAGPAVVRTLARTGPVVLTAGATTALGLGSFVAMDIEPLRQFGLFTGLGVVVSLALALSFVPAVLVLSGWRPRVAGNGALDGHMAGWMAALGRRRRALAPALLAVAAVGAWGTSRVDSRMDQRAFYNPGSPPDLADRFLLDRFGGSSFVQIEVQGDLGDPWVLRELQALADRVAAVPGVHEVTHIADVVATVNDAMEGQPRLPDSPEKVALLYGFLAGNPAVGQLAADDRQRGLLHARLSTVELDDTERALGQIEALVRDQTPTRWALLPADAPGAAERLQARVAARVLALLRAAGAPPADAGAATAALAAPAPPADPAAVQARMGAWLRSEESPAPLAAEPAARVAAALVALPAGASERELQLALAQALDVDPEDRLVEDLTWATETPLSEARDAEAAAARAAAVLRALGQDPGALPPGVLRKVQAATLDLGLAHVAAPEPGAPERLQLRVSGTPVLHRGLSASVVANQASSLGVALLTVTIALALRFRSVSAGAVAAAPTALSLLLIYGAMGLLGVRLDIGTSMLASLVIGAGVDYAVHLMSAWEAREPEPAEAGGVRAGARAGVAVWINALAVAIGFFVLTLGEARPLRNVGGLTAAAMVVAASCTFAVLPVLARRRRYRGESGDDPADAAAGPHLWSP